MINKAYFIKESNYVRYDAASDTVDAGYPKPTSGNWNGFSGSGFELGINAAVEWPDEKVYMFKGSSYIRYDVAANRIDSGYPLSISDQWIGFSDAGFSDGID